MMFDRELFLEIMLFARQVNDVASCGHAHVRLAMLQVIAIFKLVRLCVFAQAGSLTA